MLMELYLVLLQFKFPIEINTKHNDTFWMQRIIEVTCALFLLRIYFNTQAYLLINIGQSEVCLSSATRSVQLARLTHFIFEKHLST